MGFLWDVYRGLDLMDFYGMYIGRVGFNGFLLYVHSRISLGFSFSIWFSDSVDFGKSSIFFVNKDY
jgi:hypothetical protein